MMMFLLMASGCLVDWDTYSSRKADLTDNDGDGLSEVDGDCDDQNAGSAPTLDERCDGVDNDCDGSIDEDDAIDAPLWYRDGDGDGYGVTSDTTAACTVPAGFAAESGDCDDSDPKAAPDLEEVPYDGRDNDCAGGDLTDIDGDGVAATAAGGSDCDDLRDDVYPGAPETWENGATDNDCDGTREAIVATYGTDAILGTQAEAQFGRRISALGDVDGDGIAEFLVGAIYEDTSATNTGAVYLVNGVDGSTDRDFPRLTTTSVSAGLGSSMDGGVDGDGDGIPDLLVAAVNASSGTGAVWLISGATFAAVSEEADVNTVDLLTLTGDSSGTYFGSSVAFLGDIDGDGVREFAASATFAAPGGLSQAGTVGIWSVNERAGGRLGDADWRLHGWFEGHLFGSTIQDAGDLNEDGYDDFLVEGKGVLAEILPGGLLPPDPEEDDLMRLVAAYEGERCDPHMLGDVDGDGTRDLGCSRSDEFEALFFTALIATPLRATNSPSYTLDLGYQSYLFDLTDLGDLDGDGRSETIIPIQNSVSLGTAVSGVLFGADIVVGRTDMFTDTLLQTRSVRPDGAYGYRAVVTSDTTADGDRDILLSGHADSQNGVNAGGVTLITLPQ